MPIDVNDDSEPWRYRCIDCGSVQVRRLHRPELTKKSYPSGGRGSVERTTDTEKEYRCDECNERKQSVWDAKRGGRAHP